MENINTNLLNEMSEIVLKEIYGYGKPDRSDYSEYMLKPADYFFEKIESSPESAFPEKILCWSMYEAVNIHNGECKLFQGQQKLEKMILEDFSVKDLKIDSIKQNCALIDYMHDKTEGILDDKVMHFISYCMFADKEAILNGNAYWRQINLAVLEKLYLDSLNFNNKNTWNFPSRFFIGGGADGPIPVGPDYTQGPEYKWNEKEKCLETMIYLPLSDQYIPIVCSVNPVFSNISILEACDWVHLDFIIKCEVDRKTFPRMYVSKSPLSARRGIYNLFSLIFRNYANGKQKDEIKTFVVGIFHDLFWIWTGDLQKPEFGYMEAKPALVYCLYRALPYLSKTAFDDIFAVNTEFNLQNEYLRFTEIQQTNKPGLPFYLQMGEYNLHKQENALQEHAKALTEEQKSIEEKYRKKVLEEKYSFLCMMLYFLFWDVAKNLPTAASVGEKELLNYFCHEHGDLMEKFYAFFTDETWNKEPRPDSKERNEHRRMNVTWTKEETLVELFNLIMERFKINSTVKHLNLTAFETSDIETKSEILRTLLFHFSNIELKSKDALLNVMDFVGELKERNELYCQPKKGQKFKTIEFADDEIEQMKANQNLLKQKDCGFEINNYIQTPIPGVNSKLREYLFSRKLTCRFFSDTDKEYSYSRYGKEKNYIIKYSENYRQTNKNNFYCKSLYVSERNTARHYIDVYSINNILDDSYPINLLEAFCDAKDFLSKLREDKKNNPQELLIITYQEDFLKRHLLEYATKFNLLTDAKKDSQNIWNLIYTNDKNVRENIKQKLPDYINYDFNLGKQYLNEIKWFFKILYCSEPHFIDLYFPSITAYLIYLTLRIQDYVL